MTKLAEINNILGQVLREIVNHSVKNNIYETPLPYINLVGHVILAALNRTTHTEYSIDEDYTFSFETLLSDGRFLMCEITKECNIYANIYSGPYGDLVESLSNVTEEQLLEAIK